MKINKKKVGNFFGTLLKGVAKEAVSYIPVIGDNLSNTIENKIGTGVTVKDTQANQIGEYIGKGLIALVIIGLFAGWIDMDMFKSIIRLIN